MAIKSREIQKIYFRSAQKVAVSCYTYDVIQRP